MEAFPENYSKDYKDPITNNITTTLRDTLTHLPQLYGSVSEDNIEAKDAESKSRVFDVAQPLLSLHQEANDLQALALAGYLTFSSKK